jgi:hypothetical protein
MGSENKLVAAGKLILRQNNRGAYVMPDLMPAIDRLALLKQRPPLVRRGSRGFWVEFLSELLAERGQLEPASAQVQSEFTNELERAVIAAQSSFGIAPDGEVGPVTWSWLGCRDTNDQGELALVFARQEAYRHAREIGGNNSGAYVEKYLAGTGMLRVPWCVAFASWCYRQTCGMSQSAPVLSERLSSSRLVREGSDKTAIISFADGRFYRTAGGSSTVCEAPPPGCFTVVRGGPTGYRHTALLQSVAEDTAHVWEGNVRPRKWIPWQRDAVRPGSYRLEDVVFVQLSESN